MLHKVPSYDLYIYAYDGRSLVGPETLTLNVIGTYQINIFYHLLYTFFVINFCVSFSIKIFTYFNQK